LLTECVTEDAAIMQTEDAAALSRTSDVAFVVDDESLVAQGMSEMLRRMWSGPVHVFNCAEAALDRLKELSPVLVLMDIKLGSGMDGLAAAQEVLQRHPCPVIITTAYADNEYIQQAVQAHVFGYLVKPITSRQLSSTIALAQSRFAEFVRLREENTDLREALETRKMVERAKGMLMDRKSLSEEDAYNFMRTLSQRLSRSMRDIAASVIQAADFL
jgi:two-component system, response regulator PdtaR